MSLTEQRLSNCCSGRKEIVGYKKELKTVRESAKKLERCIQQEQFLDAAKVLQDLALASMALMQDVQLLAMRARANKALSQSFPSEHKPAPPPKPVKPKKPLQKRDQETIAKMTKGGSTMREIAHVIGRTPSIVWNWQKKLGVKKGARA